MTTLIRKATPADLLAALPALIGRDPLGSVVLIGFRGKRTHGVLRFDLPKGGYKRFTATAVGTFCRIPDVDDVVPVICTDAPAAAHDELMSTLIRRFRQAGFGVRDALVLGADGWGSHLDPDRRVHPIAEVEAAATRLDLEPPTPIPDRVPRADDVSCRRMRDEMAWLRERVDEGDLDELDALDDVPFLAENALSGDGAARDALLLFALQSAPVRDLVMLQWAFGLELGDALWSADTCAGIEARKVYADADSLAAELMLGRGPAPDTSRIDAARRVLTGLIGLAADDDRPAPLCMLAWLTWALGRGSEAGAYIDEALAIAPEYSMGHLLDTIFSTGTMPDWVFTSPQTAT